MNDSWGFKTIDNNWKTAETLVKNLVDIVSKGGNFLLNIGPTSEGLIPEPSIERLGEIGDWLKINGEAIYGAGELKNYKEGDSLRYTKSANGKFIYAMLMQWPEKEITIKQIKPAEGSVISILGMDKALQWKYNESDGLTIELPVEDEVPSKYVRVLKINGEERL
jgi:alpha-L-fucosidase